jgi:hypothetical protein
MSPEALYMQLGQLIAEMPNFVISRQLTPDKQLWLGRAVALIEAGGSTLDAIELMDAAKRLDGPTTEYGATTQIELPSSSIVRSRELNSKRPRPHKAPLFRPGMCSTRLRVVGEILGEAEGDVLIVDRYANNKVLTDFAVLAPDNVTMRLLTTEQY